MQKIRDLGINFIPETGQPDKNRFCPAPSTFRPSKKKARELTHETIELLQSQLQQRMADAAQAEAGHADLTS